MIKLMKISRRSIEVGTTMVGMIVAGTIFPLLFVGIPALEATRVVVVVLVQCLSGLLIWQFIDKGGHNSTIFDIGAGITCGLFLSTFCHQLFRTTPFHTFSWLIPSVFALIAMLAIPKTSSISSLDSPRMSKNSNLIILFVFFIFVGLLDQWWWLTPMALVLAVFLASRRVASRQFTRMSTVRSGLLQAAVVCIGVLSVPAVIALRKTNFLWWIISNDSAFLESVSFSVNRWGPRNNIGAAGQELSYHWFALAWSGMTTQMAAASTWTVLSFVLPTISYLAISLLVWALVHTVTQSNIASFVAVLSVLFLRDVVSTTSPTQIFSFLPFFLLTNLVILSSKKMISVLRYSPLIALLILLILGTKVSTGAVLLAAISLWILLLDSASTRRKLLYLSSIFVLTLLSYHYFYGQSEGFHTLRFGLSNAGGRLIMGRELGGGIFHPVIELFAVGLYIAPMLAVLLGFIVVQRRLTTDRSLWFFFCLIISGFILAILLDGGGTESYFLHTTFPISLILLVVLSHTLFTNSEISRATLIFSALTGIVLGSLRRAITESTSISTATSFPTKVSPYLAMIGSLFLVAVLLARKNPNAVSDKFFRFVVILSVSLGSTLVGDQVHRRYEFATSAISLVSTESAELIEYSFFAGSPERVSALEWLRDNSPRSAVVGTNRFCLSNSFCGPHKWFLASTISQRQMLIEGYDYSVGIDPRPEWASERIDVSERFGQQASAADLDYLKDEGVSYFIVDLEFIWSDKIQNWETSEAAQLKSWEPYATTVFKNEEMAILKLN